MRGGAVKFIAQIQLAVVTERQKFKIADGRRETACGNAAKFNRYELGNNVCGSATKRSTRRHFKILRA